MLAVRMIDDYRFLAGCKYMVLPWRAVGLALLKKKKKNNNNNLQQQ